LADGVGETRNAYINLIGVRVSVLFK